MTKDSTVENVFMVMFTLNGMCLGIALCQLLETLAR